uniref:Uncharacterized protein n=1 Tax=Compsopogon caeruleus TaxID=31354 RepID=A0A6T6D136_9RHOD|mmetsp:Transcript_7212/g.14819  ORF Transcript_7212/g.14819 Transcript_7212/m.14819 type:complete len:158 (+) Transcript_7212:1073-1546(+)
MIVKLPTTTNLLRGGGRSRTNLNSTVATYTHSKTFLSPRWPKIRHLLVRVTRPIPPCLIDEGASLQRRNGAYLLELHGQPSANFERINNGQRTFHGSVGNPESNCRDGSLLYLDIIPSNSSDRLRFRYSRALPMSGRLLTVGIDALTILNHMETEWD